MKKIAVFAFLTLLLMSKNQVQAQAVDTGKSASTTLSVNLANVYDIQIAQPSVAIDMNTATHFLSGNSSGKQKWHVQVTSNTGYEVKVAATTDLMKGATSIPVNTINVRAEAGDYLGGGTFPAPTDIVLTDVALAVGTQKTIISKNTGETKRGYTIDYAIFPAGAAVYVNKTAGSYSTTVTYSLFSK